MQNRDFFYWLQGHFELGATNTVLDAKQAQCILQHIELIDSKGERVVEVRTIVRMIARKSDEPGGTMTAMVREIVAAEFVHVIDPQDGDSTEQARLNAIHTMNPHLNPNAPKRPGDLVARC